MVTEERPIVRLEREEYISVVESSSRGEILTRDSVPCMILRPKEDGSTYFSTYDNGNIPMDAVIGNEGRYLKQAVEQVSSGGGPPVSAITIVHGGLSYCSQ